MENAKLRADNAALVGRVAIIERLSATRDEELAKDKKSMEKLETLLNNVLEADRALDRVLGRMTSVNGTNAER